MIVLKSDLSAHDVALAHYQIIRRSGAVIPFEPNKVATAMLKAFLAVHGALADRVRLQTPFGGRVLSLLEQMAVWRWPIQLLALDAKRTLLVRGTGVQRCAAPGVNVGVGVGHGFFSAAKPNLRNAP